MKAHVFSLLLLVILHAVNTGYADNSLDENIVLQKIPGPVHTGSFLGLDFMNSSMSFTVITENDIRESGARNLTELLAIYVPGFQYLFNPFYGTVWGMRGISNDRNTKFIVMVNNHLLNMQSRDGFKSELTLGMLGDIQRIEVMRGPAGLVYGSGAIAGIVNIISRDITTDTAFASISSGLVNGLETDLFFTRRINRENIIRGSAGWRKSDGMRSGATRLYGIPTWPFPSPFDTNVRLEDWKLDGVPSDGNHGATDGNMKLSVDWDYTINDLRKLRTYIRCTHQEESAGGLFIIDPVKGYLGWPVEYAADSTLVFFPGITPASIDGCEIAPDNPFWKNTESYGDNRRRYINNNCMALINYSHMIPPEKYRNTHEFNAEIGFDWASNMTVLEKRDGYPDMSRAPDNILETFGEWRITPSFIYFNRQKEKGRKQPETQLALGIEGRIDNIGNDWLGRNQWAGQRKHKVVSDITYTTASSFFELFSRKEHFTTRTQFTWNMGGRLDLNYHPAFRYIVDSAGGSQPRTISSRWIPMPNGKVAIGIIPKPLKIMQSYLEQSYKLQFQTSSNNGSADNYLPNRYSYNNNGHINGDNVFEDPVKTIDPYQPIIGPFTADNALNLKPEHVSSLELLSTQTIHLQNNLFYLTNSLSYSTANNLYAWSQFAFRVKNSGFYDYFNWDIDLQWKRENACMGINNTWQQPAKLEPFWASWINKETEEEPLLTYFIHRDNTIEDSNTGSHPLDIVKDAISWDGRYFLNLSHMTTKWYTSARLTEWCSVNTNCQLFWGFKGRRCIPDREVLIKVVTTADPASSLPDTVTFRSISDTISKYFNIFDADNRWPPIVKLNASIHLHLSPRAMLSLFAYNLLGIDFGSTDVSTLKPWKKFVTRNTLHPLYIADPKTNGFVSTDQQSFAARLEVTF